MGGRHSLNKGKRAEREVIKLLQPVITRFYDERNWEPPILQRNTLQSDRGGYDIVGLEWLALEVKHQQQLNLNGWWEQTLEQARQDQEPVLFYRKNNAAWRVRMYGFLSTDHNAVESLVDVAVDDFLRYFEMRLEEEFDRGRLSAQTG